MSELVKNRIFVYDFLRVVAIFALILLHISANYVISFSPNSKIFMIGNFFDSISRLCVPFFLMLSGLFMLDGNKDVSINKIIKKVLKIIFLLIFWSSFYNYITPPKSTQLIYFDFFHFWFLHILIGLYLITPILRLFVKKENLKYLIYFLVLAIFYQYLPKVLEVVFPQIKLITDLIAQYAPNFVLGSISYFIIGWLIAQYSEFTKKYLSKFQIMWIVGLFMVFCGTQFFTTSTFKAYGVFYAHGYLPVLLYSVASFVILKVFVEKNEPKFTQLFKRAIFKVAECSFGIYVLHVFYMRFLIKFVTVEMLGPFGYLLFVTLSTFVLSFLSVYLLSKIKYIKELVKI